MNNLYEAAVDALKLYPDEYVCDPFCRNLLIPRMVINTYGNRGNRVFTYSRDREDYLLLDMDHTFVSVHKDTATSRSFPCLLPLGGYDACICELPSDSSQDAVQVFYNAYEYYVRTGAKMVCLMRKSFFNSDQEFLKAMRTDLLRKDSFKIVAEDNKYIVFYVEKDTKTDISHFYADEDAELVS